MKVRVFALAFAAVACGRSPVRAPSPSMIESPGEVTPAGPPAAASLPPGVGSLTRPAALGRFFEALARLEAGTATDDVRITQFGDSHTAADWETGPIRRQLQARFGDGGRGYVPVGRPWKAWSQEGVLTGLAGPWTTQMTAPGARRSTGDALLGLAGVALATRHPGARAWVQVMTPTSRVELDYLEQPRGGSFEVVVDGARVARVATRADASRTAHRALTVSSSAQHRLEVRALGDGEVRIFGAALEREAHGIVFDALGINGAGVMMPLSWSDGAWVDDLRHRAPALVILAYGTNDAVDVETSLDVFEAGLVELAARVTRAEAACAVFGPPDRASQATGTTWTTPPRLGELIARARHGAEAAGCAFFDRSAAMGGEGAMARWATEAKPRGQQDRVHLTRDGYAALATAFVTDLLEAYDRWRVIERAAH